MRKPPPFDPTFLALNISGDLGGYTYYINKNRKVVAYPAAPALRPPTPLQQRVRARFALAMQAWRNLPLLSQLEYNRACDALSLCMWGANLFTYLSLTDPGPLLATLQRQSTIALSTPPDYTERAVAVPGPQQDAINAWINSHYPP
jgi:hypothetical protein